jgi:hypothetical protein
VSGVISGFMRLRRFALVLVSAAWVAVSVAVLPASAKEGVRATLLSSIPAHPRAGARLEVSWRLFEVGPHHRRVPFTAGAIVLRLRSATGSTSNETFASSAGPGIYRATVVVPKGGLGRIEIGMRGWSSGPSGTHRADLLFPITNAPMIDLGQVNLPASGRGTHWLAIVTAAVPALLALGLVFLVARRRQALGFFSSSGSRPSR